MEIEAPVDGLLFTCITHQSEKEISHKGYEKEVSFKVKIIEKSKQAASCHVLRHNAIHRFVLSQLYY